MIESKVDKKWDSSKRVRLAAQPLGLGIPLAGAGGYFGWNMILAFSFSEPLWLQLSTIGLILAFGILFYLGICYLLSLFERVWVCDGEVQLRLGKLVLRRIPEEKIHSIRGVTNEILVRNKDVDLYRVKIFCESFPHKSMWIDWSVSTEEMLRAHLKNTLFLL